MNRRSTFLTPLLVVGIALLLTGCPAKTPQSDPTTPDHSKETPEEHAAHPGHEDETPEEHAAHPGHEDETHEEHAAHPEHGDEMSEEHAAHPGHGDEMAEEHVGDDTANETEVDPIVAENLAKLSPEDQELAAKQKICPVSGGALGGMGVPVKVNVAGRDVLLCCAGCRGSIEGDPDKYLAKIPE